MLLKTARVSGLFKVTKPMAVGGEKAANGNGGSGGYSGFVYLVSPTGDYYCSP